MVKILELIGIGFVIIMALAFVGVLPQVKAGLSPVFWGFAGAVLVIIFYRNWKRKQQEKNN